MLSPEIQLIGIVQHPEIFMNLLLVYYDDLEEKPLGRMLKANFQQMEANSSGRRLFLTEPDPQSPNILIVREIIHPKSVRKESQ